MTNLASILLLLLAVAPLAAAHCQPVAAEDGHHQSEAGPYDVAVDASALVDAALSRASAEDKRVVLIMGANWCHDSRGLAKLLSTPRFADMLSGKYEVVLIDAGHPRRDDASNMEIARRFGVDRLLGTPNVFVLSADGERLNEVEDVLSWR
ncbi:MAG: thioredoxin family protein, partial [Pacificimonas sp.]